MNLLWQENLLKRNDFRKIKGFRQAEIESVEMVIEDDPPWNFELKHS